MCRVCETLWTISGVCCLCYLMLQPHLMLDDTHRGHHHPQPPKAVPHDLSPLEAMLTTTEALAKARGWPSRAARDALARGLEVRDGRPRPRRFEKGEGPLCAVLMWTATFVLEIAKFRVFEPFVAELDAQVPSMNMSALVDWTELGQAHTLLHVFAEHPSQVLRGTVAAIPDGEATRTLGERVYRNVGRVRAAERAKRKEKRKETKTFCDTLNRSAAAGVCYGRDDEPRLGWMKISGFAIGTDGTMLALFDDVEGNIAELRAALRHAADPMFPAGAVRQTAPLHLVIGRFVDWPVLNDTDRARVNLCVERWAAALREHREPQDGTEVPYIGATARLYELELARDDGFGFFERTTHRKVPLLEGYPEEYSDDESVRRKAKKSKKEKKKEF